MLLPVIAQSAITHYGWRGAYAILGLLALNQDDLVASGAEHVE